MIKLNRLLYLWYLCILSKVICQEYEPALLLKGVESIREQTPPSRLIILHKYESPFAHVTNCFYVIFDKNFRYFSRTNDYDESRILFNGTEVLQYSRNIKGKSPGTVEIRSINNQISEHLFDPRIMGISMLSWISTLKNSLLYDKSYLNKMPSFYKINMVGKEKYEGYDTYHVKVMYKTGEHPYVELDFWVDPKNDFRVYKFEEKITNVHYIRITSSYDDKYKWLPTFVEEKRFIGESDNLSAKVTLHIVEVQPYIKIPPNTWTIAGLNPPKGAEVVDLRTQKGLGYWDGKRVVPLHQPKPKQPKIPRALLLAIMAFVFVTPLLVVLIKKHGKSSL